MSNQVDQFLCETLLYFMDYTVKGVTTRCKRRLPELLTELEVIWEKEYAEVTRVCGLAEPCIWRYYEEQSISGQPEQEMLRVAKRRLSKRIKRCIETLAARRRGQPAGGTPQGASNGT